MRVVYRCCINGLGGWLVGPPLEPNLGLWGLFGPGCRQILVCASLLILLELGRVNALVSLIIIGREIAISALREWMAQIGASRSVAVHFLGQFKTAAQMAAIALLLYDGPLVAGFHARTLGTWLIYAACGLTIWSMAYYLKKSLPAIRAKAQ